MATDYLFVGQTLSFITGIIFMLLAFNEDSILKVVYHLFATICFIFLAQLFLMAYSATTTYVVPIHYLFYMFGIINFILFVAHGAGAILLFLEEHKYGEET